MPLRRKPQMTTGNRNETQKMEKLKAKNRASGHRSKVNKIANWEFKNETTGSLKIKLAKLQQDDHDLEAKIEDLRVRIEAKRDEVEFRKHIRATRNQPQIQQQPKQQPQQPQ